MGWQNYSTKYLSMIINLFVLWYPSAQILTNNYFYEALFKAQSNLITSERKIDKVRVCGESDYFSHLCTDDVTLNMTNPTSYLKESHRNQVLCICAARHTETLNSQLEAELSTFEQGIPCLMRSPVCSGCSWPSPSLVGMLPNVGVSVQGERTAHRCVVCTQGLGEERRTGEKQASYDFSLVFILES